MIVRIVRMTFREDSIDKFLKLFSASRGQISQSPGCRHVQLLRDTENPLTYYTYSLWESEEALNAYRQSELFNRVWGETKTYFGGNPSAYSMEAVDLQ